MSLKEIERESRLFESVYESDCEHISSFEEGKIKEEYFNPKWLPIAQDYGGNFLAIDLDPDIKGKVGQIINCGRDEDELHVVSDSFQDFLQLIIEQLEKKNCIVTSTTEGKSIVWKDNAHVLDDLVDVIGYKSLTEEQDLDQLLINCNDEWLKVLERNYTRPFTKDKIIKNNVLYLMGTNVNDLEPLKYFKHIKKLVASGVDADSFKAIAQLSNLKELYVAKTDLEMIHELGVLENLKSLSIGNTKVSNLAGIERFSNLTSLSIENLTIDSLAPLLKLKKLNKLSLQSVKCNDVHIISSIKKMKELNICEVEIEDLEFIRPMKKLMDLKLTGCRSNDYSIISELKHLKYMICPFDIFTKTYPYNDHKVSYGIRGEVSDDEMKRYSDYVSSEFQTVSREK